MSAEAPAPEKTNGALAAPATTAPGQPELNLPPGTIQLPQAVLAILTRILQQDQRVQDVLYAFCQGKGETGPLTLVLPVVLLMPPQQSQP